MSKQSELVDLTQGAEGNVSAVNATLTGYLRGPATFTIDPAVHGNNSGLVVIAGNLQVDGTQTTINSTTMDVDDLNITVAKGAANAAAANGAGLTVDGASATLLYASTGDKFVFNKALDVGGELASTGNLSVGIGNSKEAFIQATNSGRVESNPAYSFRSDPDTGMFNPNTDNTIAFATGGSERLRIDGSGRLGINQTPSANNFALQVTGLGGGSGDARAVYLKGSGAHTSIGGTGPTLVLQNTNSTANNIVKLSFESASSGETVSINAINTNHSSYYGDMAFNTRGSGGYSEKVRIMANGNVGIGTDNPQKKLEVVGDLQLDADNASIWLKSGVTGTAGKINWTYNHESTVYASAGIDYDTRASLGFHLDVGYPITLDTSSNTGIKFVVATNTVGTMNGSGLSLITSVDQAIPLYLKNTDSDSSTYMRYQDNGGQYWDTGINYANNDFYLNYGGALKTRLKNAGGIDTYGSSEIGAGTNDANNHHLRIRAGTSGLSRVIMADTVDAGYIDYNHNGDYFSFKTSGTEALTVTTGGDVRAVGDIYSTGGASKIGGTSTVFTNGSFLITQTAQTVVPRSAITSLPTGAYLMTIFLSGGGWYTSRLTGIVQHYNGTTNSNSTSNNTIHLTGSGHALNAGILQARYQTFVGNANNHGVQIWSSSQVTTSATISFKRLS